MELTDAERLMLVKKKEEILELTKHILEIVNRKSIKDQKEDCLEVKKNITSILSLLSTIGIYAKTKYNLDALAKSAVLMTAGMHASGDNLYMHRISIEAFCHIVNSVDFKPTKRGVQIRIPKIDFTVFRKG